MTLKKIRKLTVKAKKKLNYNLSNPAVSMHHPLWRVSEMLEASVEIIDIVLSGENLK